MFKDYYQILGIQPDASKEEIKQAYRKMSKKWHPDKNPGIDVTSIMQDINEAYRILNDDISRSRYDKEYQIFNNERMAQTVVREASYSNSWNYEYEVNDEDLKQDINEARTYAKNLVDEFFRELKETSKRAAKGAWESASGVLIAGIIITVLSLIIMALL